jgi:hypothetical protein
MMKLEQCVNEWRDGRAFGENDKPPKNHHHNEDRQKPEFFARSHELPELNYKFHILSYQN